MVEELDYKHDPDAPTVYKENGTIIYRASALGGCVSCLVAQRMGHDPAPLPAWLLERFEQGHKAEGPILDLLAVERGSVIQNGQSVVELNLDDLGVVIRGRVDGYEFEDGGSKAERIVEAKGFAKTYWSQWKKKGIKSFPGYSMQASIYMLATGLDLVFVVGYKEIDEEGNFEITEIDYVELTEPPVSLEFIEARVKSIEELVAKNEIPIAPLTVFCTHGQFHTADDEELMPNNELGDEEEEELIKLGAEYEKMRVIKDVADKKRKELGKRIEELMEKGKVGKTYDSPFVKITRVQGSTTWLDKEKMRENGIDIEAYERQTLYTYPKITEKYADQEGGS